MMSPGGGVGRYAALRCLWHEIRGFWITPPLASKKSSRWARRGARLQGPPQRAREHLVDSEAAERIDQTASADLMTDDAGGARCALLAHPRGRRARPPRGPGPRDAMC